VEKLLFFIHKISQKLSIEKQRWFEIFRISLPNACKFKMSLDMLLNDVSDDFTYVIDENVIKFKSLLFVCSFCNNRK